MDLNLNYEGFEQYLIASEVIPNRRVQYVFMFDNGYGASVIKAHPGSYGAINDLWELAVVRDACYSHIIKDRLWYVTYDTPITDDVIGYLTNEEVLKIMKQIQELPEKE